MMDTHRKFREWVVRQGVKINGIEPHEFQGRGVGIVAQQNHKVALSAHQAGDILLTVPADVLVSITSVVIERSMDGPVHGLLALYQSKQKTSSNAPWRAVVPRMEDFRASMPFLWPPALQSLLPFAAKELLANQQRKYAIDVVMARKAYPDIDENNYLYHWMLINTRTFYWVPPGTRKIPPRDDCLALVPFADYFNHADSGCNVQYGKGGITITADKTYETGEEIYISYGPHSNDFLLAEYGFILDENKWDEVRLDEVILPELSAKQRKKLGEFGFLGNYVLDNATICYRTEVVLRFLCVSPEKWEAFVASGDDDPESQEEMNKILTGFLNKYVQIASSMKVDAQSSLTGEKVQRESLIRRWDQVLNLLVSSIKRINYIEP